MKKLNKKIITALCFVFIIIGVIIYNQQKASNDNGEYMECVKRHNSFTGAGYAYVPPSGVDCSKYTERIVKEYGAVD